MVPDFRLVIISGLSGSGKTTTLHELEDLGYFCVDNLPISLLPSFIETLNRPQSNIRQAAVVIDIRAREALSEFPSVYQWLKAQGVNIELIFLECDDKVILKRYGETRRPHPLSSGDDLIASVRREREALKPIRDLADKIWDSTNSYFPQFRREIREYFSREKLHRDWHFTLISFSYRSGIPFNADLVLDARCLPNPFFADAYRHLTGLAPEVQDYIFNQPEGKEFLEKTRQYLLFLTPLFRQENKPFLTIACGCTGGQHRSVAVVERLGQILAQEGFAVKILHRDLPEEKIGQL